MCCWNFALTIPKTTCFHFFFKNYVGNFRKVGVLTCVRQTYGQAGTNGLLYEITKKGIKQKTWMFCCSFKEIFFCKLRYWVLGCTLLDSQQSGPTTWISYQSCSKQCIILKAVNQDCKQSEICSPSKAPKKVIPFLPTDWHDFISASK